MGLSFTIGTVIKDALVRFKTGFVSEAGIRNTEIVLELQPWTIKVGALGPFESFSHLTASTESTSLLYVAH